MGKVSKIIVLFYSKDQSPTPGWIPKKTQFDTGKKLKIKLLVKTWLTGSSVKYENESKSEKGQFFFDWVCLLFHNWECSWLTEYVDSGQISGTNLGIFVSLCITKVFCTYEWDKPSWQGQFEKANSLDETLISHNSDNNWWSKWR